MKKLFLILLLGMFLISVASAITWDNVAYYKLDESSGSVLDAVGEYNGVNNASTTGVTGKINTAYFLNGVNNYVNTTAPTFGNYTYSLWIYRDYMPSSGQYEAILSAGSGGYDPWIGVKSDGTIRFHLNGAGYTSDTTSGIITTGSWYHIVITGSNNTNASTFVNGVNLSTTKTGIPLTTSGYPLILGRHSNVSKTDFPNKWNGTIDEVGIWNRSLSSSEITELYNSGNGLAYSGAGLTNQQITLITPINATTLSTAGTNFTANFNITGENIYNYVWKNATFKVWKDDTEFNFTIVALSGNNTRYVQFMDDFTLGNYKWNILGWYGNDTFNNYTTNNYNFTFNVGAVIEDQIYNNVTYETRSETFQVNVTHPDYATFVQAYLVWNGTEYPADSYMFGSTRRLTRTIIIPTIETSSEEINFYWKLIFSDAETNTSSSSQTINEIELTRCTSGTKFITLNLKDEQTNLFLGNTSTINILFTYYGSSMASTKTINQSISGNNVSFCFSPTWGTINIYGEIEYEDSTYIKRYYYFMYKNFDNQTDTYNLYDLLATESTSFIVYFTDYASLPMQGAYLELTKKSTASDEYKIVEMSKTDDFGMGVLHYISEDEIYKINFYDSDGSYLYSTGDFKAVCLDAVCTQRWELPYTTNPDPFEGIREDPNFDYFLDVVNDSIFLIYDSTDDTSYNVTFEVYGLNVVNETQLICSSSETNSISGTIICNISSSVFDLFLAKVLLDGDLEITRYLNSEEDEGWKDYGTDGIIYAILIITTLTLLLIWRWEACIIGCVAGVVLSGFLGFIPGVYSTIGYLIVVAIYLLISGGGK